MRVSNWSCFISFIDLCPLMEFTVTCLCLWMIQFCHWIIRKPVFWARDWKRNEKEMIYELIKSKNTHHWSTRLKYIKRAQKSDLFSWVFHVCSAPGGFFHRESLCIDTCFSAPSVYSVQTQTLYNTLLFTTVQNQQTPWISSAASSGFWQLLFQVTEEKDAHFWLFNVDLIWWNTYNVVVRSIQRSHCDSAWSCDCFWRTRRHYRV